MPLLDEFAVSDDAEREQLELSSRDKERILGVVRPLFGAINAYLNSFGDAALSETAMRIGDLAQLASELDIEGAK